MDFKKGDRVKHPSVPEWGVGEVIRDSNDQSVTVFFEGVGEKELSLAHVKLQKVEGADAESATLDTISTDKKPGAVPYRSLPASIRRFLKIFPEGFYGEKYEASERRHKLKAHQLAQELLADGVFATLLQAEQYEDICQRAMRIVNATNLVFSHEKMALKNGINGDEAQKYFAYSLYDLLHGQSEFEERFNQFVGVLRDFDACKWTTVTYFPFIMHPSDHMFVKPSITQQVSELCNIPVNYHPEVNWLTYKSVLDFSQYLMEGIQELKPRDMIDVQSFMWCITPGHY